MDGDHKGRSEWDRDGGGMKGGFGRLEAYFEGVETYCSPCIGAFWCQDDLVVRNARLYSNEHNQLTSQGSRSSILSSRGKCHFQVPCRDTMRNPMRP